MPPKIASRDQPQQGDHCADDHAALADRSMQSFGEEACGPLDQALRSRSHMTDLQNALNDAVEAGTVTPDTAKAILNWIGPDGRGQPPTERAAAITREVLEQIDFQVDVVAHTEAGTDKLGTDTVQPDQATTATEPLKTNETGRKKKLSAAGLSRAAKAWADKNPAVAAALVWHNAAATAELIAPDTLESEEGQLLALLLRTVSQRDTAHIQRQLQQPIPGAIIAARLTLEDPSARTLRGPQAALRVAARLPAVSDHDIDGEPISVLAAARLRFAPVQTDKALIPPTPSVRIAEAPEDRLPDVPPSQPKPQLLLPSMPAAERSPIGTAPWLKLFDRLGGQSMQRGTGAPAALRLWIEALAWASPAARSGRLGTIPLTVRDLRDALWPNGWNRGKQLPALIRACQEINSLGWIRIPELRSRYAPVLFRQWPDHDALLSDPVLLEVQLPTVTGAGAGAAFDRDTLRALGLRNAPEYRAYLGLIDLWDRYGRRGGTKPGRFLPALGPDDRRRLVFGDDGTVNNPATLRSRQRNADRAVQELDNQGVIELRPASDDPRKWRILRRDLRRK